MALTNGPQGSFSGPLIYVNARSKDTQGKKITPRFEIARKGEDGKFAQTDETCTRVTGDLLRPRFTVREYEGSVTRHVQLYIRDSDAGETYCMDCTYRIATRQLFNAIISLDDPKALCVSIWETKKGYEALSLWQDDKLVPWKYDGRKGEIPEPETVMFKGKPMHDYEAVDTFFEEELRAWAERVFGPEKVRGEQANANTSAPAAEQANENTGGQEEQQREAPANQSARTPTRPAPAPRANPPGTRLANPAPANSAPAARTLAARPTARTAPAANTQARTVAPKSAAPAPVPASAPVEDDPSSDVPF